MTPAEYAALPVHLIDCTCRCCAEDDRTPAEVASDIATLRAAFTGPGWDLAAVEAGHIARIRAAVAARS